MFDPGSMMDRYEKLQDGVRPEPEVAPTPQAVPGAAPATGTAPSPTPAETLEDVLADLDALVGMTRIKEQITTLSNLIRIRRLRTEHELPNAEIGLHMLFLGNPGTGKTTLARIMGRLYKALGMLETGHLVECARQDLVAEYQGQTAMKTDAVVKKAFGGVLFVDEAYTLADDSYGQESIATLLKLMEDHRSEFVVIAAGYPTEMAKFLDSNSGLASRFAETVTFPDYSAAEMQEIFSRMVTGNSYVLSPAAAERSLETFTAAVAGKAPNFANARVVRGFFEDAVQRQANRLTVATAPDKDALQTLEPDDLPECAEV